jgi:hypothetical protein
MLALGMGVEPKRRKPRQTLQASGTWMVPPFRFIMLFRKTERRGKTRYITTGIVIALTRRFVPQGGPGRNWADRSTPLDSFTVHGQIHSLPFFQCSLSLSSPRGANQMRTHPPEWGLCKPCSSVARVTLKGLFPTLCRLYRRHAIISNNRHPTPHGHFATIAARPVLFQPQTVARLNKTKIRGLFGISIVI